MMHATSCMALASRWLRSPLATTETVANVRSHGNRLRPSPALNMVNVHSEEEGHEVRDL